MQGSRILGSDILNLSDGILSVVSEVTFSYVLKVKDNTGSGVIVLSSVRKRPIAMM